jgi:N-acetyl-gamma-glutamyl-phosphate/LysW-gamma-L-alpha-aminoadipyl-6-phosphate reductase
MIFKGRKRIDVGIIGGAGYGGAELIKLLLFHPRVKLSFVTSRRFAGRPVASINRFLTESTDLLFIEPEIESLPKETDLVFLATPHGISMSMVPDIIHRMPQARIIDLSGDFRLKNRNVYMQYYNKEHSSPGLLQDFVYGLPELNREAIRSARYVANPGCFATGIIFALYPLFSMGAVKREVSVTSVTGSSGSGELAKEVTHHPVRAGNFKAYKILEHQHLPEIGQFLRESIPGWNCEIGLVPQSGPFVRGIFTTALAYNESAEGEMLREAYEEIYGGERFVRIVAGTPELVSVNTTNYVEVSAMCKNGFIVAMSAIDNLVRGASGQAVQNMNLMFGFHEDEGLTYPGMRP